MDGLLEFKGQVGFFEHEFQRQGPGIVMNGIPKSWGGGVQKGTEECEHINGLTILLMTVTSRKQDAFTVDWSYMLAFSY